MRTTTRSPARQQFLLDILTTACEGGIGYWSFLDSYSIWENPSAPTLELIQKTDPQLRLFDMIGAEDLIPEDADTPYTDIYWKRVAEEQGWDALPEQHRYVLNIGVIASGLKRFWEAGHAMPGSAWQELARADHTNGQEGDVDSSDADQIVQWGLFGRGIYG